MNENNNYLGNVSVSHFVNNFLLIDEEKILNLIREACGPNVLGGTTFSFPESFDSIPESVFDKMSAIDKAFQANYISMDVAIKAFAGLFEGEAAKSRFEEYVNNLYGEKIKNYLN